MADKARYNEILSNPMDSNEGTIARLIEQYPYTQPLRFLQAQKQYEAGAADPFAEAMLYTAAHHWLYGLLTESPSVDTTDAGDTRRPVSGLPETTNYYIGEQPYEAIDEQEEIALQLMQKDGMAPPEKTHGFHIDDPEAQAADEILQTETSAPTQEEVNNESASYIDDEGPATPAMEDPQPEPSITDALIPDHPVAADYLAYEERMAAEPVTEKQREIVPLAQGTPHEKISLYDDDHMPYSFLWWLNKTRMEFAHTYRPYAPRPKTEARIPDQEERILDQQIRENIFHLQSPEEKLSEPHRANTVAFQIPRKIDPVIERFIREEPQIKPPQADKIDLENKARQSAEDQLTLVTETLARIYEEQGLYPKAIAIYKKLSLKYPEKSAYFAGLINTLENKLT